MLAVLNRYKLLFALLLLFLVAALIWLLITLQGGNKIPSKGVFVLERSIYTDYPERGYDFCSR